MPTLAYLVLGLIAAVALGILVLLLTHVENWSRDLITHSAATDEHSSDERLKPLRTRLDPGTLAEIVASSLRQLPHWHFESRTDQAGTVDLHFVRVTKLLRFKDDINVRIVPQGNGSLLTAQSRSRIGLGDLGQNPRNLRELLAAVKRKVG